MTEGNDLGLPGVNLDVNEEGGIPDFLQRQETPVFTTQVADDGQVELAVEAPVDEQANEVLEQLAPQEGDPTAFEEQPAHSDAAPIDPEGTEGTAYAAAVNEATSKGNDDDDDAPGIGHNAPADPAEMRRDFFKDVNKFGKASGEGASALGRLGLRALRAAADGVLSTAKPQGGGKDDATLVYEAYTAMDSKHAEHTAGGAKANASKLRQVIAMGCMTTLSDPVAVGDRVVSIRERMEGADLKPKALFAALVDAAREQIASDTELTDAQIEAICTKTKADKTLEKEWTAIQKKVEGLITGEASHGLKDTSDVALKISDLCLERLKQYKRDETRNDLIDTMMERGYTKAQAEAIVDRKND